MANSWLTKSAVSNVPKDLLPMMVFSDNMRSFFSFGIKAKEKGFYNHFMWMYRPGFFASQDRTFREVPTENYVEKHRLKFCLNLMWSAKDRATIRKRIAKDLARKWYKRTYDYLAILGQAINMEWIQIPGLDICSDKARYLRFVDDRFDLKHPSPTNINQWLKEEAQRSRGYEVFARYSPD